MKRIILTLMVVGAMSSLVEGYEYSDYDWQPYNGKEYALTKSHTTWLDAEAEAVSLGSHLVTIDDMSENSWLSTTFEGVYSTGYEGNNTASYVWIGFYKMDQNINGLVGSLLR